MQSDKAKYELREVWTKEDKRIFLDVAVLINGKDPNWIQPLDNDVEAVFDPAKNKLFEEGEAVRWVLFKDDRAVGRIAAFYNRKLAMKESQPTGGCGFFESIDNQEVANRLFTAARDWLKSKGMEAMDGSINFGDRLFWWGVLVEGFHKPLYGMSYNQPYYGDLFEKFGFKDYFNQYTYLRPFDLSISLNDTLKEKADRLYENSDYKFSGVSLKKSNLKKLAEDFRHVYNSGWGDFEEIEPMNSEQAYKMIKSLKPIIDPEMVIFAYHKGEPAGIFVMIPDLNQIIYRFKGKFGLLQKMQLVWQLKIAKSITGLWGVVFGVAAEHQGKGVDAGMIRYLENYVRKHSGKKSERYTKLEMSWIGDFNPLMMRVVEQYVNASKYRRLVTYRYLFDREKPFERCPRWRAKRKK